MAAGSFFALGGFVLRLIGHNLIYHATWTSAELPVYAIRVALEGQMQPANAELVSAAGMGDEA